MPVDASIPLQVHQVKVPTAQEMLSLQNLVTQGDINKVNLQEKQLEVNKKNALLQVMQDPTFADPGTGRISPQGLAKISQIDPGTGIQLAHQQQQLALQDIQVNEKKDEIRREVGSAYVNSYHSYLQTGTSREQAERMAKEDTLKAINERESSGDFAARGISKGDVDKLKQLPGVDQMRTMVTALGGKFEQPPKLEHTTAINPETKKLGLYDSRTGQFLKDAQGRFLEAPPTQNMIRMEMDTKGDYSKTGEDFLNTIPAQYRNMVKKVANYEMDPKTFSTIGGSRERALAWASQYDPNFDQKEYNSRFQAVNKFNTGQQGNTVRSLNVAVQHMDTARKLGEDLKNTGSPAWNKVAQEFAKQTGSAVPTNFESVKDILADEVVKGVLGSGGGVGDREAMAAKIKASSSPEQLSGALDSWTELLGGQVEGLKTQYESSTGRKDFDSKLSPRTREAISAVKGKGKTGSDWVERAMKANPSMSREEVEAEGKRRGKL